MLRTLALLLTLLVSSLAPAQDISNESDLAQQLDREVRTSTYGQFWGCVMVSHEGRILLAKGYGLANRNLDPITADSLLELASVTKQFTAVAILRLEMQGKLATTDPISKHLANVPADKQAITIHQLITHTSGLGQPDVQFGADEREAVVAALLSGTVKAAPGAAYEYSNAGYWLLAAIIERTSGKRFEDYVRDEVLRPAGMMASAFQTDPALDLKRCVDRVVNGRASGNAGVCPYSFTWGYRGSGGLVVSARDMFAWDQALRGDALLNAAAKEKMHTPALNDYAYGWEMSDGALGRVASHTGGVAGFAVSFTRYLDTDASILVITNQPHNPVAMSQALGAILFPESVERVGVTLRPGVHGKDENSMSVIPGSAAILTTPAKGGGVTLRFTADVKSQDAPLEIRLSKPAAIRVAAELKARAADVLKTAKMTPNPPVRVEMYSSVYAGRAEPIEVEGPEVTLAVQAGTPHPEPGGNARVTLIVQDPASMFWPVFVKLAASEAERLAEEITKALGN